MGPFRRHVARACHTPRTRETARACAFFLTRTSLLAVSGNGSLHTNVLHSTRARRSLLHIGHCFQLSERPVTHSIPRIWTQRWCVLFQYDVTVITYSKVHRYLSITDIVHAMHTSHSLLRFVVQESVVAYRMSPKLTTFFLFHCLYCCPNIHNFLPCTLYLWKIVGDWKEGQRQGSAGQWNANPWQTRYKTLTRSILYARADTLV